MTDSSQPNRSQILREMSVRKGHFMQGVNSSLKGLGHAILGNFV